MKDSKDYDTNVSELKETNQYINAFEQLEMEVKLYEENYIKKLDEKMQSAFGKNIKFKMFETNLSNENLAPICEMYVTDNNGNWLNAINGINTGHGVPRLVEFLLKVKKALGVRDSLILIDFFESIGTEPLTELKSMGQQIIATEVRRDIKDLKVEYL